VPITTTVDRYDQKAYYLVKNSKIPRFGILTETISRDERKEIWRNTGSIIKLIYDDTPAFYANLIGGDLIIEIDGNIIFNANDVHSFFEKVPSDFSGEIYIRILRQGEEKLVVMEVK
jgi:C-terminal processing protease CtpA/Prc